MSFDFDLTTLKDFKKPQLCELVMSLKKENDALKSHQGNVNDRLCELERSHYLYLQYGRRNSIEITGIPDNIDTERLEDEVIKVFDAAGVQVDGRKLSNHDMEAVHRIGKKGVTIARFVNRKFAYAGLRSGKNLKGKNIYGDKGIYISTLVYAVHFCT